RADLGRAGRIRPRAEHHLFPPLPPHPQHPRAPPLHEGGGARDPLGEEALRRLEHRFRRQRHGGRVRHGRGRIVMPVGCSGTAMLATLVLVCRSITFTAPGSTPLLSCETKAYRPSGAYATPCGNGLLVGIRATSVNVAAPMRGARWSFL